MRLLFDVGNTRVKWVLEEREDFIRSGVIEHVKLDLDTLNGCIGPADVAESIWVSSVASEAAVKTLCGWAEQRGAKLNIAKVTKRIGRLENSYSDISHLGVDRWMAAIAARSIVAEGALLVVDAGTAVTIDLVDELNCFQGGVIFPGAALMHDTLTGRTAGVKSSRTDTRYIIGKTTQECVNSGVRYGFIGAVERIVSEMKKSLSTDVKIIVAGGDASLLMKYSSLSLRHVEDLVLRGLLVYAILGEKV